MEQAADDMVPPPQPPELIPRLQEEQRAARMEAEQKERQQAALEEQGASDHGASRTPATKKKNTKARKYYYADKIGCVRRERKGPVLEVELIELIRGGAVAADTRVWTSDMAEWGPLAECVDVPQLIWALAAPTARAEAVRDALQAEAELMVMLEGETTGSDASTQRKQPHVQLTAASAKKRAKRERQRQRAREVAASRPVSVPEPEAANEAAAEPEPESTCAEDIVPSPEPEPEQAETGNSFLALVWALAVLIVGVLAWLWRQSSAAVEASAASEAQAQALLECRDAVLAEQMGGGDEAEAEREEASPVAGVECDICFEPFDRMERTPRNMKECGHTFCAPTSLPPHWRDHAAYCAGCCQICVGGSRPMMPCVCGRREVLAAALARIRAGKRREQSPAHEVPDVPSRAQGWLRGSLAEERYADANATGLMRLISQLV